MSGPQSIRIRVVFVSSKQTLRSLLSLGSLLSQTGQWHPRDGTPPDVPVPSNVTLADLSCIFSDVSFYVDLGMYFDAKFLFDVSYNSFVEGHDFLASCASLINQN